MLTLVTGFRTAFFVIGLLASTAAAPLWADETATTKAPDTFFAGAVTEKLLMYATGRNVQYFDAPAIRRIVREAAANDYKFSDLVLGITQSVPFQTRRIKEDKNP